MKKLLHPAPSLREKLWRFAGTLLLSGVLWVGIYCFVSAIKNH